MTTKPQNKKWKGKYITNTMEDETGKISSRM